MTTAADTAPKVSELARLISASLTAAGLQVTRPDAADAAGA